MPCFELRGGIEREQPSDHGFRDQSVIPEQSGCGRRFPVEFEQDCLEKIKRSCVLDLVL
jgi:hypothetical protein